MNLEDFRLLLIDSIKKNHLEKNILSICCYGSFASNNTEHNFSDIDLWCIINIENLNERINVQNNILGIIKKDIRINLEDEVKLDILFFNQAEFHFYINLYPTRVIYPFKKNVWKTIFGIDFFENIELPSRNICLYHLPFDYEFLVYNIQTYAFIRNPRILIKYFLRIMKKAIWILKDEYLPTTNDVLEKIVDIFLDDNALNELLLKIKKIKKIKRKNYNLTSREFLFLYSEINSVIEAYGHKIQEFYTDNNLKVLDFKKFYNGDLWENYAWNFAVTIDEYLAVKNNDKRDLLLFMKNNYIKYINNFNDFMTSENEMCGSINLPLPKRSRILEHRAPNENLLELINFKSYIFLIDVHRNNILNNTFSDWSNDKINSYILNDFLPSLYELFLFFLKRENIKNSNIKNTINSGLLN